MTPNCRPTLDQGQPIIRANCNSTKFWLAPFEGPAFIPVLGATGWQDVAFLDGPTDQVGPMVELAGSAVFPQGYGFHIFKADGIASPLLGVPWNTENAARAQWTYYDGVPVNAVEMVMRKGPAVEDAFTVPAHRATHLGSVAMAANGTMRADVTRGQDRRWDVWSRWHRRPMLLQVQDPADAGENYEAWLPANNYQALVPFNNDPNNRGTILSGAPEQVNVWYHQSGFINAQVAASGVINAVGWNSLSQGAGYWGKESSDDAGDIDGTSMAAHHIEPAAVGINFAAMLAAKANAATSTMWGGGDNGKPPTDPINQVMYIEFMG